MKFFTFDKSFVSVLITVLFVVFFGSLYFFIYLPHNEKFVQEQRFRSLQTIDKNIHAKIDNSVALMNNLLTAYLKGDPSIENYIRSYSTEKFALTVPVSVAPTELKDSGYVIHVDNNTRLITLKFQKRKSLTDSSLLQMSMQLTFEQFIKFLLPENVFDEYVIFSNEEVVYETFPSGINSLKDTSSAKNSPFVSSTVRSINASGQDYKLFLQPVKFSSDHKWMLGGLLKNKRYQQEKNELPPNIVLLLVTAVLIIIVAFPWIKLYQMGNKDRVKVSDGIASIVVGMLLMSLLFFSFFKYNRYLRPAESVDSKEKLADQITSAFQNEIDTVYKKLKQADHYVSTHKALFRNTNKLHIDTDSFGRESNSDTINSIISDTSIKQVFWLNKDGKEVVNWTAEEMNAPLGDYKNRDYFKEIAAHKEYLLHNDPRERYYLDQVVSWVTGKFTSVISIHSEKPDAVAAMSFTMRSLDNPVLPTGYEFAIIDNSAKVLYHSDVWRNLNENLLTEFSASGKLKSCIKARTRDAFKTKYFSNDFIVLFMPIARLPYSIVIFSDSSYNNARDMEIYSFTVLMLILLFAFLILQLFVVFLVSSKRSYFRKQLFEISWIGPKASSHHQYNLAIIFNLLIIFLAILFFKGSSFLTYVYILLFSVTFISIFLNSLFAVRYKSRKQPELYKFKKRTLESLIIFTVILNLSALKILDKDSINLFLFYEYLSLLVALILGFNGNAIMATILKRYRNQLENWNYAKSYALMSLTRLIITSGIPLAFFYISSYNYEQNISIRYRQLQYANNLMEKVHDIDSFNLNNNNNSFNRGFYNDSAWIKEFYFVSNPTPARYSEEDTITSSILGMFRVNFTDLAVNNSKFHISQASDSSFFYNPLLKDACRNNKGTVTYRQTGRRPGEYLKLSAASLNYRLPALWGPSWLNGILFWLMLVAALVLFYFIIYNILNKLFCLHLHHRGLWNALDEEVLSNENLNNLVFIIGLPGSGKLTRIKEKIRNGKMSNGQNPFVLYDDNPGSHNVFVADLINIPDVGDEKKRSDTCEEVNKGILDERYKLIIVNHFEYNIQDPVTNRIKLNFLENLMLKSKSKIVILSTIHPVTFLDSVNDPAAAKEGQARPEEDLERWHVLLGHYRIVVFPLDKASSRKKEDEYYSIYQETGYTHFLKKMQESAIAVVKQRPWTERKSKVDQLTFKLQVTSHYFYMYIWQSLTKEEKFLLYDLAEDNLVNSYDDYNLNLLLAKGVIIRQDGSLQLFNRGFTNFILTAIGNTEAMKIKNRIKDNGNWSNLRYPLLIVLLAILTFLLTFQEEAYSKIITYVAALGTGVPTVIKLFSVFDRKQTKE